MAPGATPRRRLGASPAESANRSAQRPRPDRGPIGAPTRWIPIGMVGAHRAAATKRTRSDRVRLGRRNRRNWPVRSRGRTARPARRDAVATDAALRDPGATQPQGAAARRPSGNGRPEAGGRRHPGHGHGRPKPPDAQARSLSIASVGAVLRMAARTEKGPAEAEP